MLPLIEGQREPKKLKRERERDSRDNFDTENLAAHKHMSKSIIVSDLIFLTKYDRHDKANQTGYTAINVENQSVYKSSL